MRMPEANGRKTDIRRECKMDKEEKYTISVEDTRWIAEWAGRRLTGDERDTVRQMMKIAREMDGPDKSSVKIHADRAIRLCNEYPNGKNDIDASIEIKKELIKVASFLPCGGVPDDRLRNVMDHTADARNQALFMGTVDKMTGNNDIRNFIFGGSFFALFAPIPAASKLVLGAVAAVSVLISALTQNKNERMREQEKYALSAIKYCVSVELERPVLPDRFDELYADGLADVRNGKIVITASDEYLDDVADALRENALDELGIRIGEKDMTRERLQEIARMIVSNRREKLDYPRITAESLDGIDVKQSIAAERRGQGVLKRGPAKKAQEKKSSRKRSDKKRKGKKSGSKEAER